MTRATAKAVWFGNRRMKVSFGPGKVFIDLGDVSMTRELRSDLNELLCRLMNGTDHNGPEHLEIIIQSVQHSETINYNTRLVRFDQPQHAEHTALEHNHIYSINDVDI